MTRLERQWAILTQEMDDYSIMTDLIIQALEEGAEEISVVADEFGFSPVRRLVRLYDGAGRKDDARQFMLKHFKNYTYP